MEKGDEFKSYITDLQRKKMTRPQEACIKISYRNGKWAWLWWNYWLHFGKTKKKIVTSALWRNPNGDARLKTDVWHIWQKESTCASKFFFAILPFRSWPDKEQQLSSFSGTHMAYFLLVSSIPNVFSQLYHLAKEFRSPFFFQNFNNCDFSFHFQ